VKRAVLREEADLRGTSEAVRELIARTLGRIELQPRSIACKPTVTATARTARAWLRSTARTEIEPEASALPLESLIGAT
jgi:hypothetical protein